jgi:hypothetical protein
MKAVVIRVEPRADDAPVVEFTCGTGTGKGRWRSSTPPERGARYDVELDVEDVEPEPVEPAVARLSHDGSTNRIVAFIESIHDDGLLIVRLSPDCLLMVETPSWEHFQSGQWISLRVPVQSLSVWPFGF